MNVAQADGVSLDGQQKLGERDGDGRVHLRQSLARAFDLGDEDELGEMDLV